MSENLVRDARHRLKLGFNDVSRRTGISVVDLSSIERGYEPKTIPTADQVTALAKLLSLSPAKVAEEIDKTSGVINTTMEFILQARSRIGKSEYHKVVECPKCGHELQMVRSTYNGHVTGQCKTSGCLAWME